MRAKFNRGCYNIRGCVQETGYPDCKNRGNVSILKFHLKTNQILCF